MKYGLVVPALALLIAMNIFPLVYNIRLSFTDAKLTADEHSPVGGDNYGVVFSAEAGNRYAGAVRTTATFVACAVSIELVLGFILAMALKDGFPGKTVILIALLVPMMLSPAVMGLYWNLVLNEHFGVLNRFLASAGLSNPPAWLTGQNVKFWSIVMIDVWMWTPFMMLIAMAGLNSIPKYIYEAAAIDRAGPWMTFRRITLPMCAPLLLLAALLRTTDALKQFDYVMAITGPNDVATQTLSTLLYQVTFENFKTGLGSAYSCVVLVIVIALANIFLRYIDKVQRRGAGS
jgi:multiple sugar transport system permease protein